MNFGIESIGEGVVNCPVTGLRFLHPVLFMDKVELSGHPEKLMGAEVAKGYMARLGLLCFSPEGGQRRRLTEDEVRECLVKQRGLVEEQKAGAVPKKVEEVEMGGGPAVEGDGRNREAPSIQKECAICLEKLADALILPCGHTDCCMECLQVCLTKGDHRCPQCRSWIETILPQRTSK